VTGPDIDYAQLFAAIPSPCLVMTPDLIVVGVNQAYLEVTRRERKDVLGRGLFDAFPGNPADRDAVEGLRTVDSSLHRVLDTAKPDAMAVKYDIPVAGRPGAFEERYWSVINAPVLNSDGTVMLVVHRAEDVTAFVRERRPQEPRYAETSHDLCERKRAMEAELYARAKELERLNEQLRQANARQREVALALQRAMLPEAASVRAPDLAIRYLPAVDSLNVCGDWYELVALTDDRLGVAVGDVVGHGLSAAGVMGQLRSALSAAIRVADGPAGALEALDLYACSIDGAMAATAVQVVIDHSPHTITYSCAGHLPPVLLQSDHTIEFLDQATHPPLGVCQDIPHVQVGTVYRPGATLAMYTDGLLERRGEDIDDGMRRLTDSLLRHCRLAPEPLADAVLTDLGAAEGAADDIALVIIRL
jgi:serine phosphatase RsbU (regulator of sigma subunit)